MFHQSEQGIAVPDLLFAERRDETLHRPFHRHHLNFARLLTGASKEKGSR